MLRVTAKKASQKRGFVRGVTVTAAAEYLGVTRTHVSLVLHGHRSSKRLLMRLKESPYRRLLRHGE